MTALTAPTITPALTLAGISIRYTKSRAGIAIVDDFDLVLESGQMHCLAGRSGSGKTSLLRVAAGLARPDAGDVRWAETSLGVLTDDEITRRRRDTVGYLDQGGVLVEGLTVIENVLLPAVPDRSTGRFAARASDLLTRLGVSHRITAYPHTLSGGERQRVALARALLREPAIIMADEPTASLDRRSADAVIELLRGLADSGIAVLVAAHDQHLIDRSDTRTELA